MQTKSLFVTLGALVALSLHAGTKAPEPLRLSGRVLDAENHPVAGAVVECFESANYNLDTPDTTTQRVTTGPDGAYEFKGSGRMVQLVARKAGLAPAWHQYWSPTKDQTNETLVLTAPTTLEGSVVDEADKPVAEAEVWVSVAYTERQTEEGGSFGSYLRGKSLREFLSTHTGADGKFRIEGFPSSASCDLAAKKPGKVLRLPQREYLSPETMLCRAGQKGIKLVLEPAGGIAGKVVAQDTEKPVAGALLYARLNQPGHHSWEEREPAKSGADGAFRLADLAPGKYILTAAAGTNALPEWVAETVSAKVEAGQTTKDVKLVATPGGFLEATVLGKANRKPVAGVGVNANKPDYGTGRATGTNGNVLLRLPAGKYQVAAYQDNSHSEEQSAEVELGRTNRVELELPEPPKITGVVRDASGAPASGLPVAVWPNYRANAREVTTDANGRYELSWNPQGWGGSSETFCIIVRDTARNLAVAEDIEADTRTLDLRLQPALVLEGRVEDVKGKPLTNGTLRLYLWSGNSGSQFNEKPVRTDGEGRFKVTGLPPGRKYSLDATAKGYGSDNRRVENEDGGTNAVQLEPFVLRVADRQLAGQVLDAEDKPIVRAWVSIYGEGQPNNHTRTDEEGRFKFDAVCEGSIRLSASAQSAYGNVRAEAGDTNVILRLGTSRVYSRGEAPKRAPLTGKPLPELKTVNLSAEDCPAGKPVLLCLFDLEQRPSRRFLKSLAEQYDALKQKGLVVAGLQTTVTTPESLKELKASNPAPFPVGYLTEKSDKTKWAAEVESLPWLILADAQGKVVAEGFDLDDLDSKLKGASK